MSNIPIKNNKRVRGQILTLLYSVHPSPIEVRTISNALLDSNYITSPDIAAHIDYLADKRYITAVDEDVAEQIMRGILPVSAFLKLSAHGIDLIEGTIEDNGVDV